MNIVEIIKKIKIIPEPKLLQLYPPFLFIGLKVVDYTDDLRQIQLKLPMRWYLKNMHGTFFGGVLAMICDPFPAVMIPKFFKDVDVWTKRIEVEFLKPSRTSIHIKVELSNVDCRIIQEKLDACGSAVHDFYYAFTDERSREIARVRNSVYVRRRRSLLKSSS